MTLTEGLKVAVSEADKPISMGNDDASDLPKLNHLHEPIELFALVVETTANVLHPLIHFDLSPLAVGFQCGCLISQIRFLSSGRHPGIHDSFPSDRCLASHVL